MQSPIAGLARFFDAAAKDLETNGKSKVGELKGSKEAKVETKEELKVEEVKTETTDVE
jgi:hypothetical protein